MWNIMVKDVTPTINDKMRKNLEVNLQKINIVELAKVSELFNFWTYGLEMPYELVQLICIPIAMHLHLNVYVCRDSGYLFR